jgi:hypothetical protein
VTAVTGYSYSRILPMQKTRKALLASLLISVTVALGYALAGVPNVELMTMSVFVSGYLLGWRLGAIVGAVSIAAHSLFNPLGAALPPLFAAQVIGFSIIGVTGATLGRAVVGRRQRWVSFALSALLGFLVTSLYDLLTNVGAYYSITTGSGVPSLIKFVAAGMAFVVMHLVWNTVLFLVVLTPVLNVLARYRHELAEGSGK